MKELEDAGQTIHWLKSIFSPRRTLLVIDMQNDFISGSLPVPGAAEIIDDVESLTKLDIWYQVGGILHVLEAITSLKYRKYNEWGIHCRI